MPPRGAMLAEPPPPSAQGSAGLVGEAPQTPEHIAATIRAFLQRFPEASVLEDGKMAFALADAQHTLATDHGRCTLQLWSAERNLTRTVVHATERNGALRLQTARFGHAQTKLLQIVGEAPRRTPAAREPARKAYLRLLERVLTRAFAEWQLEGFRAAMDLERSFGPAYVRGTLVRGNEAWAVIGVGAAESQAILDGTLTLGILWLQHCRESGGGKRLYRGLRLVMPAGASALTLARLAWMNTAAAQWELWELDERTEELEERDPADQGNLRTRLVHAPDPTAAHERFAEATAVVLALVPPGEQGRVEQRLRSSTLLAFLLHGLEFARARAVVAPGSFRHQVEISVGNGGAEIPLAPGREEEIRGLLLDLFARRDARVMGGRRRLHPGSPARSIGAFTGRPAHARNAARMVPAATGPDRLAQRERALSAQSDPIFRAAPERWLESVLRENLAPLTRSLAPRPAPAAPRSWAQFANEADPDTRGNRADAAPSRGWPTPDRSRERIIPHFDPRFVYTQVPAIAGASDRGMLDLLGVTADGRLAVIELKAADDLQLALQGLDYWIRVRHHHRAAAIAGAGSGPSDLQQHGYFGSVELSPLPPRLYLVAPALHIHPATQTVLRFLSPEVEWTLLALDERWRQEVRVVWRSTGGRATT